MNETIKIVNKHRILPDLIDFEPQEIYINNQRFVIDTRKMKFETAKMFNEIKYGRGIKWNQLIKVGLTYKIKMLSSIMCFLTGL